MVYELKNNRFVLACKVHKGMEYVNLEDNAGEIDKEQVEAFVKKIPDMYEKSQATIGDLGFTQKDYDSCRQNILADKIYMTTHTEYPENRWDQDDRFHFYGKDLDYDKLIALVDSVKAMEPAAIDDNIFYIGDYWHERDGWEEDGLKNATLIVLVNNNNEKLQIKTSKNSISLPPFYSPWFFRLNGVASMSRAPEIYRFFKTIYPSFLGHRDNVDTIRFLVTELYKKQEKGVR
jgi:hypothetical protein